MIDTQSCLVDFEKTFKKDFKVKNFEIPSNSLSDNIVSTEKIKMFSKKICESASEEIIANTNQSAYTNVRSNIILPSGKSFNSMEGYTTRDGHLSYENNNHLINNRKKSFKSWIRERIDY